PTNFGAGVIGSSSGRSCWRWTRGIMIGGHRKRVSAGVELRLDLDAKRLKSLTRIRLRGSSGLDGGHCAEGDDSMKRRGDVRGAVGPIGAFEIQRSVLYKALTAQRGDIEIWQADVRRQDGWWYYWLVSQTGGAVHQLALVRYSYDTDQLQEQIAGPFG